LEGRKEGRKEKEKEKHITPDHTPTYKAYHDGTCMAAPRTGYNIIAADSTG
jgi:hypothetical protein